MHKTTQNTIMLTRERTKYQARAIATIALHTWASTETWAADRSARGAAMPSSGAQARPQRAGSSSSLLLPPQNTAAPTSSPRAAAEACAPAEMAESHEYSARSDLAADSTLAGRGLPGCRPCPHIQLPQVQTYKPLYAAQTCPQKLPQDKQSGRRPR